MYVCLRHPHLKKKIIYCACSGSSYCQLIRTANKTKRLEWAIRYQHEAEAGFCNVIWTDECTIQLETHHQFYCRKKGNAHATNQGITQCITLQIISPPPPPPPRISVELNILSNFMCGLGSPVGVQLPFANSKELWTDSLLRGYSRLNSSAIHR